LLVVALWAVVSGAVVAAGGALLSVSTAASSIAEVNCTTAAVAVVIRIVGSCGVVLLVIFGPTATVVVTLASPAVS